MEHEGTMRLCCDNISAINIAHNPVQHDRTKHIEINRHFIKEKLESGLISTPYTPSKDLLANVLTKGLPVSRFQEIITQLFTHQLEGERWKISYNLSQIIWDIMRYYLI